MLFLKLATTFEAKYSAGLRKMEQSWYQKTWSVVQISE
jgi:hypothetical protein